MPKNPRRPGGTPPVEHQFKPGQSGNPGGRPKKHPTLRETSHERLARRVPVMIDGKRQDMPLREVLVDRTIAKLADRPEDFVRFARWLDGDRPPAGGDDIEPVVHPDDLEIIRKSLERIADDGLVMGGGDDE